jgi:hypothetical protein
VPVVAALEEEAAANPGGVELNARLTVATTARPSKIQSKRWMWHSTPCHLVYIFPMLV